MQNIIRRAWQDYIINWASLTGVFFFFFFNQPVSQRWLERGDTQQGVSIWTPKQGDCGYVQEPQAPPLFFYSFIFGLTGEEKWVAAWHECFVCKRRKQKCLFQSQRGRFFHTSRLWKLLLSEPKTFGFHLCPVVCLLVCLLVGLWAGLHILISTKPGWGMGLGLECIFRCGYR